MNGIEQIINLADKANRTLLEQDLIIPILDKFEIVTQNNENDKKNFVAKYDNNLEQFLTDGILELNETFDEHIKEVNSSIKESLIENELYKDRNYLVYYKTYQTSEFSFKIYLQDILMEDNASLKFIRQLTAYFINKQTNEFCQLSLASGPYKENEQHKLLDNIQDFDDDEIIKSLDKSLTLIMDNIHYE